jgi:hypothetical protein
LLRPPLIRQQIKRQYRIYHAGPNLSIGLSIRKEKEYMPFKVKDLMINVIARGSGGGGTALPADDTTPVPTPITPIAITAVLVEMTPQAVIGTQFVKDAMKGKDLLNNEKAEIIARAAQPTFNNAGAFGEINRQLAAAVVGAAVIQSGGSAGMPNPDCGGSSMETIPTPLTPVVRQSAGLLRAEHLPRLRERLTNMLAAVDAAEKTLAPRGKAVADVKEKLRAASAELEGN